MARNSDSYSWRMPSFTVRVSFGDGVAKMSVDSRGEKMRANSLAERPPGSD